MIRFMSVLLVAVTLSGQQTKPTPPAPQPDVVNSHHVLRISGQESAKLVADIVYSGTGADAQKTDIYIPANAKPSDKPPLVIALSGADKAKHWGFYRDLGQVIAASGMIAVIPDKRYRRGQTVEGSQDIRALIAFVKENGSKYSGDGSRVCLWAFSAGGMLLNVGMRGDLPQIKCLVNFYGVVDIGRFPDAPKEAAESDYNPIVRLRRDPDKLPPTLIARAGKDRVPLNEGLDKFVAEALAKNLAIELINYPEGQHGFDLYDDNDRSRQIVRRALQFMRENFGEKPTTAE